MGWIIAALIGGFGIGFILTFLLMVYVMENSKERWAKARMVGIDGKFYRLTLIEKETP